MILRTEVDDGAIEFWVASSPGAAHPDIGLSAINKAVNDGPEEEVGVMLSLEQLRGILAIAEAMVSHEDAVAAVFQPST